MLRSVAFALAVLTLPRMASPQATNQPGKTTTSRAQAENALDSYFAAMHSHDFSHVPYTPAVVFRGSLHTEPVRGDSAVRAFFVEVAQGARSVRPQWRVIDGDRACTHYEYETTEGAVVPVVACFRFERGRIAEERAFFDPRPFLRAPDHPAKDTSKP
jgi:SnoaL-like domain